MSNVYAQRFHQRLDALRAYAARTGHSDVPLAHIEHTPNGPIELGEWVAYVRLRYRKHLLAPERVAPLEQIPGWHWNTRPHGPKPKTSRNSEIRGLRDEGWSLDAIAEHCEISKQRVHQILKRGY